MDILSGSGLDRRGYAFESRVFSTHILRIAM